MASTQVDHDVPDPSHASDAIPTLDGISAPDDLSTLLPPTDKVGEPPDPSRRRFLRNLGIGIVGVSVAGGIVGVKVSELLRSDDSDTDTPGTAGAEAPPIDYLAVENVPLIELNNGVFGQPPEIPDANLTDPAEIIARSRGWFTYGLNNGDLNTLSQYVYTDSPSGQGLITDVNSYIGDLAYDRTATNDPERTEAWLLEEITSNADVDVTSGTFTVDTIEIQYALPTKSNNVEVYRHFMRTTYTTKTIEHNGSTVDIWAVDSRQEISEPMSAGVGRNPHYN